MPSSPRLLIALLPAVSVLLPACEQNTSAGCPGAVFATLGLHGTLDAAATGCAVAPQAGWNVPAMLPDGKPDGTFVAELSWEESTQQLAYCSGGAHAAVLYGTRSGDHLHAQASVSGAVLGQCSSTCTPVMTVTVDGDLSSASSPATFTGTLTETFDDSAGDCGTCRLPCTSAYALTGTAR
jgi:hypothetical protein